MGSSRPSDAPPAGAHKESESGSAMEAARPLDAPPAGAHAMALPDFGAAISPHTLERLVVSWLDEDVPTLDIGGHVVGDTQLTATLYCKAASGKCVLCGQPFFDAIFNYLKCKVEWESFAKEGEVNVFFVGNPSLMLSSTISSAR